MITTEKRKVTDTNVSRQRWQFREFQLRKSKNGTCHQASFPMIRSSCLRYFPGKSKGRSGFNTHKHIRVIRVIRAGLSTQRTDAYLMMERGRGSRLGVLPGLGKLFVDRFVQQVALRAHDCIYMFKKRAHEGPVSTLTCGKFCFFLISRSQSQ